MSAQTRNNVIVSGSGPVTLVFAHGFGCDQSMWRRLVPAFVGRYRIVLFDLVGAGGSDLLAYRDDKYASLHGHADDLRAVCEAFAVGPSVVVSHSVSGMISLLAAIDAPNLFAAQIMVGPSPSYIKEGDYDGGFSREDIDDLLATLDENYLGWSNTMAPVIMGAPQEPALSEELTNSFCRTDPDIAKHFARVTFLSDHRESLTKSNTPTLILQSTDDVIAPMTVGDYMHRTMPDSELAIIDNMGHCPHLSAPTQSIAAIEAFLKARGL